MYRRLLEFEYLHPVETLNIIYHLTTRDRDARRNGGT